MNANAHKLSTYQREALQEMEYKNVLVIVGRTAAAEKYEVATEAGFIRSLRTMSAAFALARRIAREGQRNTRKPEVASMNASSDQRQQVITRPTTLDRDMRDALGLDAQRVERESELGWFAKLYLAWRRYANK